MFLDTFVLLVICSLLMNPWSTLKGVSSKESSIQNIHFIAAVTNPKQYRRYLIEEWIQIENEALETLSGKIVITDLGFSVFKRKNSKKQILLHANKCFISEKYSPGNKTFSNTGFIEDEMLSFGPSYYFMKYNQKELPEWTECDTKLIRGIKMKCKKYSDRPTINIYEADEELTMNRLLRVEQSGRSEFATDYSPSNWEEISMDFHTVEYSNQDFRDIIAPTPGIGCLRYFEDGGRMPEINFDKFHYYTQEYFEDDKPTTRLEVFVDRNAQGVRTVSRGTDNNLGTFADYRLGTKFTLAKDGECQIEPIQSDERGIVDHRFDALHLLWMKSANNNVKYVGRMFYDHRSGILCDVWESREINGKIDGETYDKVVTSHYFTENFDEKGDNPSPNMAYLPVGSTRIGYNRREKNKYVRTKFHRQDIYEFGPTIEGAEYRNLFQISDCYPDPKEKLSLTFDIRPKDSAAFTESLRLVEENLYDFKESFERYIVDITSISKFRIASIDFDFAPERILSKVMFLEKLPIEAYFTVESKKIQDISSVNPKYPESLDECLQYASLQFDSDERNAGFLWCEAPRGTKACVTVKNGTKLMEDEVNGMPCQLFRHPVGSLRDVANELPLKSIHNQILANFESKNDEGSLRLQNREGETWYYTVKNIMYEDMPYDFETTKQLYTKALSQLKLSQAGTRVSKARGPIQTLGDCYRACKNFDQIRCSAFSYCSGGSNYKECLLTDEVPRIDRGPQVGNLQSDSNCDVYEKQHLLDYQKIDGREFIGIGTGRLILAESPEKCAKNCEDSKDCDSFQFCGETLCSLVNTSYMALETQPKPDCSIHTRKKLENFKLTGNSLVREIIHIEVDINLDQCATLCYQNKFGEDKCQSFNYCPKGTSKSSCQLASVTLSTSKQESLPGGGCKNYELIDATSSQYKAPKDSENISKASGGTVFGIIMAFGLVGLMIGVAASFGWSKYSRNSVSSSFVPTSIPWSKHKEEEDQVQIHSSL